MRHLHFAAGLLGLAAIAWPVAAFADIRVMCYQDGNECDVTADLIKRYEAQNPGAKVLLDVVPYKTVVEQLPIQLAAGQGPDIAPDLRARWTRGTFPATLPPCTSHRGSLVRRFSIESQGQFESELI